jgi:hypothetical protein
MTAIRLGSDGFDCHLAEAAETVRMAEREGATSNSPRGSAAMGSDTSSSLSRVRVFAETGSQTSSALHCASFAHRGTRFSSVFNSMERNSVGGLVKIEQVSQRSLVVKDDV